VFGAQQLVAQMHRRLVVAGAAGAAGYYESPVHLGDKLLCAEHGIPQIVGDTAGPAAMMAAFRSVPIYLNICREAERRAPDAVLLNHANPMAVLCRAMVKYSQLPCVIGICHGVQAGIRHAAGLLGVPPRELDTVWIGTNHYYWFTRMRHRGRDVLPELWRRVRATPPPAGQRLAHALSHAFGHWIVYPEDDHIIEFHPFLAQVQDPTELPYGLSEHGFGKRLRPLYAGEETLAQLRARDGAVSRAKMLREYRARLRRVELPAAATDPLAGEGTARLIADIATGRRGVHIGNVPNQGSVTNLPREAVLEVEVVTDSAGVRPICAGDAPPALEAILRKRIAWQELVVDAAVQGDRRLALQAMQIDDAAIPPERAARLLAALLRHNAGLLPTFAPRRQRRGA